MLAKARRLRDRMDQAGDEQAVYEAAFEACGYSRYKRQFGTLARHLPYDRARQLTRRDPRLLEAALLHIGGLLPEPSEGAVAPSYLEALQELRAAELSGLRSAGLPWDRGGVRPINYPERRIAGFALFISRTAQAGLAASLDAAWDAERPRATRSAFEAMFPPALGFWATRCTWTGKTLPMAVAPIGAGRVRSIIGNVFIPFALADARRRRDRTREERVFGLYARLPKEPDNRIVKAMIPRFFGAAKPPRLGFRAQQGLLQLYTDWCELNPSCENCRIPTLLAQGGAAFGAPRPLPRRASALGRRVDGDDQRGRLRRRALVERRRAERRGTRHRHDRARSVHHHACAVKADLADGRRAARRARSRRRLSSDSARTRPAWRLGGALRPRNRLGRRLGLRDRRRPRLVRRNDARSRQDKRGPTARASDLAAGLFP